MHSWAPRNRCLGSNWKNFSDHFSSSPTSRVELSRQWVRKWGSRSCSCSAWFFDNRKRLWCTCAGWQIELGSIMTSMNYRTMRKNAAYLHRFRLPSGVRRQKLNKTRNGKSIPSAFNKSHAKDGNEGKTSSRRKTEKERRDRLIAAAEMNVRSLKGKKYVFKGSRSVQECSRQ